MITDRDTEFEKAHLPCGCVVYTRSRTGGTATRCAKALSLGHKLIEAIDRADATGKWGIARQYDLVLTLHYRRRHLPRNH